MKENYPDLLLKELNHRYRNDLQIISSIISLSLSRITDQEARHSLNTCKVKINTFIYLNEFLLKLPDNKPINMYKFINGLTSLLFSHQIDETSIKLIIDAPKNRGKICTEKLMPISLIICEAITNSFKYAFKNTAKPLINVTYKENDNCILRIIDNGCGFSEKENKESLGHSLIYALAKQIDGKATIKNNKGALVEVVF